MRDVDDGLAGISPDHLEQAVALLRHQARRRLERDDAAATRQRPADLDKLAIGHAEL
jgi:hypothetical protein